MRPLPKVSAPGWLHSLEAGIAFPELHDLRKKLDQSAQLPASFARALTDTQRFSQLRLFAGCLENALGIESKAVTRVITLIFYHGYDHLHFIVYINSLCTHKEVRIPRVVRAFTLLKFFRFSSRLWQRLRRSGRTTFTARHVSLLNFLAHETGVSPPCPSPTCGKESGNVSVKVRL